ncbi:MAG: hypothetical protein NTZ50_02105 [Chloroflexi bacterium]|nr:hypothetical protein [Chloroflexota bacterium]
MSKKSRRLRTPNLPPEAYFVASGAAAPDVATAVASVTGDTAIPLDMRFEYKEVIGDLRRTFIIFISMVVVMLALSFVI